MGSFSAIRGLGGDEVVMRTELQNHSHQAVMTMHGVVFWSSSSPTDRSGGADRARLGE